MLLGLAELNRNLVLSWTIHLYRYLFMPWSIHLNRYLFLIVCVLHTDFILNNWGGADADIFDHELLTYTHIDHFFVLVHLDWHISVFVFKHAKLRYLFSVKPTDEGTLAKDLLGLDGNISDAVGWHEILG